MAGPAWILAGLGNPGARYQGTRHDLGFALLARLAASAGAPPFVEREGAEVAGPVSWDGGAPALLVRPLLFMNRSGPPLKRVLERAGLPMQRLLVACDDIHLPLGRVRLREQGSAGGHNGLASVVESLGPGFPRLRMGVGREPDGTDRADWVLSRFSAAEEPSVGVMLAEAEGLVRSVLAGRLLAAPVVPGEGGPNPG